MGTPMARPLNVEELRNPCAPKRFRFETTDEVAPLSRIVGQQRALAAIDFGLNMHSLGLNIYVLGESGTGKASAIRTFVSEKAKAEPVPTDWAYVFNFSESAEPIAVSRRPGRVEGVQRPRHDQRLLHRRRGQVGGGHHGREVRRPRRAGETRAAGARGEHPW